MFFKSRGLATGEDDNDDGDDDNGDDDDDNDDGDYDDDYENGDVMMRMMMVMLVHTYSDCFVFILHVCFHC